MAAKKKTVMKRPKTRKMQEPSRPVYFLSLRVENVRCFGPMQKLDLSDGKGRPARWTVILGNNGVGKTTLLQCLTALEVREDEVTGPSEKEARTRIYRARAEWSDVFVKAARESRLAVMGLEVAPRDSIEAAAEGHHYVQLTWDSSDYGPAWISPTLSTPLSEPFCYGYGATRRMGAGALSVERPIGPSDSLFQEDVPLRNAEEWLLQADYAASKKSPVQEQAKKRRDRVVQVLKDLLPDINGIRFVPPTSVSPAQVEFRTPYGWVGMQRLSLGYRALIAWMVDLASRLFERYPASPNPLAEPAVVLVDEIDLHLHPKWQRRLIGYLNEHFPQAQFIVTAHSPLVVQSATDANIVVLRQEGDHVVIDNDVASIRGWRVDQILTSDLFGLQSARPPQLDTMLAERTALLSKVRLTKKDRARLEELEKKIGPLPAGETQAHREALDIIQRFAKRVGKDSK